MKKYLSILLAVLMVITLTSCMFITGNTTISSDGTGQVSIQVGILREAYDSLEASGADVSGANGGNMQPFVYDGKEYIGTETVATFTSLDELNGLWVNVDETTGEAVQIFRFEQKNGKLLMSCHLTDEQADPSVAYLGIDGNTMTIPEESRDEMLSTMVECFSFQFPGKVSQESGRTAGVEVSGNSVQIDLMAVGADYKAAGLSTIDMVFSCDYSGANDAAAANRFPDVANGQWYTEAVRWAADQGLVNGYDNGNFGPSDVLTREQFCQVLAKAVGVPTGADETGWWAGKAVSGVSKGLNGTWYGVYDYKEDLSGFYDRDYWTQPIPREEAVFAVTHSFFNNNVDNRHIDKAWQVDDIPDYYDTSMRYRAQVITAYNYGVTKGVDSAHTFNPKGSLTRAEICQLFMNVMP